MWLPAGLSVKHLECIQTELASACWAREVRLLPVRSQAALVLVDVVRHDPLGSRHALTPPVVDDVDNHTDEASEHGWGNWNPSGAGWPADSNGSSSTSGSNGSNGSGWLATPPPPSGSPDPAASNGNGKRVTRKPGTIPSDTGGAEQVDKPVTGFGGVDVTDYI